MLHLLQEKPRHGYDMIKAIEQLVGGGYEPQPRRDLPTLTLLEEMGHASVQGEDGGKKLYTLSAEAKPIWKKRKTPSCCSRCCASSELRRQERPDADSPELRRAVQNFRMAPYAPGQGQAGKELHAIIDIIDRRRGGGTHLIRGSGILEGTSHERTSLPHHPGAPGHGLGGPAFACAPEFRAGNHDDIFSIVARLRGSRQFDSDTSAQLALGLKLFSEVMLKNRKHPLFEDISRPCATSS
jgi:DNA-binding PadR family transcriptional regulator